jgi:acylphosphatase
MLKLTAYVSGKVQMAGYRSKVVTIARAFGLKGYVGNLPDGRVKIVAEGPDADLERFREAVRIKNTLIDVAEIEAEFSDATGAYEEFFKIAGERETDARLDQAAEYLKELISAVREGFKDNGSKLDGIGSRLDGMGSKLDCMGSKLDSMSSCLKEISGKQDQIIDTIDYARGEIVSEVQGMRSDLKGRTEERLQRIESDVTEIKAKMRS